MVHTLLQANGTPGLEMLEKNIMVSVWQLKYISFTEASSFPKICRDVTLSLPSDLSRGAVPRRHQGLPYGPAEWTVCGLLPRCLCLESMLWLQCFGDGALCHTALDEPGLPGCKGQYMILTTRALFNNQCHMLQWGIRDENVAEILHRSTLAPCGQQQLKLRFIWR